MAMTSATTRVWYVLIDHEGKPMGTLDEITVTDTLSVAGLRTKIQEKERHGLSHFDARQLTLFECADSTSNLKDSDKSGLPNILDRVFSSNAVQELLSTQEIATLQLQNKTVIVLVPGALHVTSVCFHLFCTQVLRHYRYPAECAQARRQRRRRSSRSQASEARIWPWCTIISSACLRIQPHRRTRSRRRLQSSRHLRFSSY